MSSQALRHLSMFLAAAIIICGLPNMLPFLLYITVRWNCPLYSYFLFIFFFPFCFVTCSIVGYGPAGHKWYL